MALTNFMGANSYAIIQRVSYDKQSRYIGIEITVYSSPSKAVALTHFRLELQGTTHGGYPVKSRSINTPPESPEVKDAYLVASEATGAWVGLEGKVVAWNGMSWDVIPSDSVYVEDEGKHIVVDGDGWVQDPMLLSPTEFDAIFAVEQLGGEDNNILKACYEYLKTRNEFAGAQDA
jgi:hypothetical protein